MSNADMIAAMRAEGIDAETILSVVSRLDNIKADRAREKTRQRVRRHRENQNTNEINDRVTESAVTSVTDVTSDTTPLSPPLPPTPPNSPPISPPATTGADVRRVEVAFQQFVAAANRQPAWPVPKALNKARRTKLAARLRDHGLEEWGRAIKRAERSAFLTGQTRNPFSLSLDWLVEPKNLLKVMEGNYDDRTAKLRPINGGRSEQPAGSGGSAGAFARFAERMESHAAGDDAGGLFDGDGAQDGVIDAEYTYAAG